LAWGVGHNKVNLKTRRHKQTQTPTSRYLHPQ
jgi:hypothetical protein